MAKPNILAIIYSNSPQTDQAFAVTDFLQKCEGPCQAHINTHVSNGDKMWVISSQPLKPQALSDLFANEWVGQTQIPPGDPSDSIRAAIPKLRDRTYVDGIAADLDRYMAHRKPELDGLMRTLCRDVGETIRNWDREVFADLLQKLTNPQSLLAFADGQSTVAKNVVSVAFAIG